VSSAPVPSPTGRPSVNRRKPPGWRQWALALGGAAAFLVALIVFVNREDSTANRPAGNSGAASIAEQNREARIIVETDQAPHTVALTRLPGGRVVAGQAIRGAVVGYMKRQIAAGSIGGPLMRSACTRADGSTPSLIAFHCRVIAANVAYPFLGVVDTSSRQVTYCKRDAPPVPSMNIPVSRRCT
jgi:hypothetical protein